MFDTHCHLNFKAFKKNLDEVIKDAQKAEVNCFLIPGTDIGTSIKAVEIATNHEGIYAAVGIHPHHVYEFKTEVHRLLKNRSNTSLCARLKSPEITPGSSEPARSSILRDSDLIQIENLLKNEKVVAIGEMGIDKHIYQETKYEDYQVSEEFISLQKELFISQIRLAIKHNKSLIIHNREAVDDVLGILVDNWVQKLEGKTVFHCCEPEEKLLEFANAHKVYIGVDGDITYNKKKQEFIKKIPLERLVLETDAPFLLPEPLKSEKKYPNVPANLPIIAEFIAKILDIKIEELLKITTDNSKTLFNLITKTKVIR